MTLFAVCQVCAAAQPHTGPTVTEWILAFAAAIVSPLVTLYVMHWQNNSTLAVARDQNANALAVAQQQNATALRVARQQVIAEVVSAARHRWMDTFVDTVAECLAIVSGWAALFRVADPNAPAPGAKEAVERLTFLTAKLSMLMNPSEQAHQRLTELLNQLISVLPKDRGDPTKLRPLRLEITALARDILNRERERTTSEVLGDG
jgi:hypothetical protein